MKLTQFRDIPKFISGGNYRVNVSWNYLENYIKDNGDVDLDPDFQRGHVWTKEKQEAYIQFILRGGNSSRDIYFNHPGWMTHFEGTLELVDGKQRMEAVRAFLRDEIAVYGSVYSEFTDNIRAVGSAEFTVHINNLQTRAEVLQWYLDLNSGGVVHTEEELARVQDLLRQEQK